MDLPKRKLHRLQGYDYSQEGAYYITICTSNRRCALSHVIPGDESNRAQIRLTPLGNIAEEILNQLTAQYGIKLASNVIMPNHIHMILIMENRLIGKSVSVGRFVGAFKSIVSNRWQKECDRHGEVMGKLWQRDYYDHIIRNEADMLEKIRYIDENPDKWHQDKLYMCNE